MVNVELLLKYDHSVWSGGGQMQRMVGEKLCSFNVFTHAWSRSWDAARTKSVLQEIGPTQIFQSNSNPRALNHCYHNLDMADLVSLLHICEHTYGSEVETPKTRLSLSQPLCAFVNVALHVPTGHVKDSWWLLRVWRRCDQNLTHCGINKILGHFAVDIFKYSAYKNR